MPFAKNNLSFLEKSIRIACLTARRSAEATRLMVVSKGQPVEAIQPLLEAGHRLFGENRVQEAADKWPALRRQYPDLQLHLIGPLQTNKTSQALRLFDVIESVDRESLACALAKAWSHLNRQTQKILIQVNIGHESQKSGVAIKDLAALVHLCQTFRLPLTGLMAIPPVDKDPALFFEHLAHFAKQYQLPDLSMGMSRDYPIAIAKGATWVRIGTALWA